MKKQLIILMAGALLTSPATVFAGQDYSQRMQIERAMAAKQKAAMELAAKQREGQATGVAGAKGEEGQVGPGTPRQKAPCTYIGRQFTCPKNQAD